MGTPALVSAQWLANMVKRSLVGPHLRILDTSWYLPMMNRDNKKEFAETHIPGASFFDIDECSDRTSKFDHMLPSEQFFADYVGRLGIGNDSQVVVYDASDYGAFSCTRVWWMFRLFGHNQVSVLNGGFRNWVREGHPVTEAITEPEPAHFTATINRPWVKSFEDVTENITTQRFQVVDVRPYGRFCGKDPEPREGVRPGHIPGSKCMPFFKFMDQDGMMLSTDELKKFFERSQVDLSKHLCGSCGSGVTACHMVLAAHLCGVPGASVYDGSWYEWFTKAPPEHVVSEVKNTKKGYTSWTFPRRDQHAIPIFHGCLWKGAGNRGPVQTVQRGRGGPGAASVDYLWLRSHSMSRRARRSPARLPWGLRLRWLLV